MTVFSGLTIVYRPSCKNGRYRSLGAMHKIYRSLSHVGFNVNLLHALTQAHIHVLTGTHMRDRKRTSNIVFRITRPFQQPVMRNEVNRCAIHTENIRVLMISNKNRIFFSLKSLTRIYLRYRKDCCKELSKWQL